MPEYPKAGILDKELFAGGAEGFTDVVFQIKSVHRRLSCIQIGIYRLLFLITLKNPVAKKTALTNKNDNNTMN